MFLKGISHLQQGLGSRGTAAARARQADPQPDAVTAAASDAKAEAAAVQLPPDRDRSDYEDAVDEVPHIPCEEAEDAREHIDLCFGLSPTWDYVSFCVCLDTWLTGRLAQSK